MPGWLDNGFHAHMKRELVPVEVDGLLARAISRSCDQLTDGFVEASWVDKQLETPAKRKRVIDLAVKHRVLEKLPAGETIVMRGKSRTGLRKRDVSVSVGPFPMDGFVVHDFLDCNRSRSEVEARRDAEAKKKRGQRDRGRQQQLETPAEVDARRRAAWAGVGNGVLSNASSGAASSSSSSVSPGESPLFFEGDSRDRDRDVGTTSKEETFQSHAHARAATSADPVVQSVLDVLADAPRLFVDAIGVENAVRQFPTGDAIRAAREAVTKGRDPAWRQTNAATLIWKSLEQQTKPSAATSFAGSGQARRPRAEDFQALKDGAVA